MKTRPLIIILFVLSLAYLAGQFLPAERTADIMGTSVRVKVLGYRSYYLAGKALAEIRRLDRSFSRFDPKSEISLINRLAGVAPLQVSEETLECLRIAAWASRISRGAFDVTLGNAKELVVDNEKKIVFIKRKGVFIDLGGIGKGFAAENARKVLLKSGAKSGMIDMRSSIAVFGKKRWKIGVQHPRQRDKLLGKVELTDGLSLATSGDYERGKHILDPRSGKPAERTEGVTVIGRNAAECDALSTALFVLGPIEGSALIKTLPGFEMLIIDRNGGITGSKGFDLKNI